MKSDKFSSYITDLHNNVGRSETKAFIQRANQALASMKKIKG